MRKRFLQLSIIGLLALSLSSCVYLIVGGVGALGGYIVSPDTVEGITNNDLNSVWASVISVTGIMGIVEEQSKEAGILIGRINGCKVTITLTTINQKNVKVSVKARKAFFPKINVAQDVFVKVMTNVEEK
jgi:hypothetical protein